MNAHKINLAITGVLLTSASQPAASVFAQERGIFVCPVEPALQNWTQSALTPIPNFIAGEQAGVVVDAPGHHYPIEITAISVRWASQIGMAAPQIEQAIHLYPGGLPNPGAAQFSLPTPTLVDGVTNVFDISGIAGNKIIYAGPFSVALEFLNTQSPGNPFVPSVVADGDGCQPNKNMAFTVPGGWADACQLGVNGDWVFDVSYRRVNCDCNDNDDLAGGTSADCNTNSIPDECDVANGMSPDCNTNAIPDECELDTNDCNTNSVPDECDPDFDDDGWIDDCDDDIDDDGVNNVPDMCDFTPQGANIVNDPQDAMHGTLRHDSDGDCDVDLTDFARFQVEMTGANP